MNQLEQHLKQLEAAEQMTAELESSNCPACGLPVWAHGHIHDEIVCAFTEPYGELPGLWPKFDLTPLMPIAPTDTEFLRAVQYSREQIAAIFRVPPHMLGWTDQGLLRAQHNRAKLRASRGLKPSKYRALLRRTHA